MVKDAPGRELGTQELPEGAVQEPDGSYAVDKPVEDEPKAPAAPAAPKPAAPSVKVEDEDDDEKDH
jgi:hypothetical protein